MSIGGNEQHPLRVKAVQCVVRKLTNGVRNDTRRMEKVREYCSEFMVPEPRADSKPQDISPEYDSLRRDVLSGWLSEIQVSRLLLLAEVTAALCVADGLKTNQIRKFLDGVKQVSTRMRTAGEVTKSSIELLKIPLVYAAARQEQAMLFAKTCIAAIDRIRADSENLMKDWQMFERFVEAIVAYHRFYKGED